MKLLVNEFLAQAAAHPDRPAVMDCYGTDTYGCLNRRSAVLAARLLDGVQGQGTGMRVGVLLPRARVYLTAVLGILRAGGAVVPLEEDYPAERVQSVLRDAGCMTCISTEQLAEKVSGIPVLTLEDIFAEEDTLKVDETINLSAPDKEGLILFTSGSTGKPKGVVHPQTFFSMWLHSAMDYHVFSDKDITCCMAGMTFIASFVDLYPPLMVGGSVYIASSTERMNADMLHKIIQKRHITGMFLPPQMFYVMRELYGRLPLDYVVLGGEKVKPNYTMDGNIVEVYGSSECAAILLHRVAQEDSRMLGKPGNGVQVYLISDDGELIKEPGVLGELCVESPWVALRYNNLPEETAAKFTDNPFGAGRLFHTGDYMAYDEAGNLLFHGRKDHMVKLRGYRVELGEVELTLQRANGVKEAACVTIRVHGGDKLACYYVGEEVDSNDLRNHVKAVLPEYMVPDYFVYLDEFPRNERNKVDYLALKNMEPPVEEEEYEPPQNEQEARICRAFAEVLDLPRVSVLADFFNMGGTSLSVAMLVAKLDEASLSFNDVASYPTPRALAAYLQEGAGNHQEKLAMDREFYPLTKTQMGIYLEGLTGGNNATYTLSYLMVADTRVTAEQLVRAVNDVVAAHPSMKYVIRAGKDGIPHMYMVPEALVKVPVIDGSEDKRLGFIQEFMPVVPMTDELLFYFAVYRTPERCYLALKSHLIFFDATSLSLLISELNRALGSYSGNVEFLQEDYTIQQVGMYEEALMQGGAHEQAEAYYQNLFAKMDEVPSLAGDREGALTPGVSENIRYIPKNLTTEQVKAFCSRYQLSEGSFFMGAMAILLSKYLSSKQVSFSSVYNGRARAGMDTTIGTLIKRIPVYGDFTENISVVDYLKNMGRQIVTSMGNDIYSFDEVLKHCPVNEDVEFIYQGDLFTDNMGGSSTGEGSNLLWGDSYFLEHYHTGMVTGCFSIQFFSTDNQYNMTIEYRNERFSPAFAERFAQDLFTVAEGLLTEDFIGDISLLTPEDKETLAHFNDTAVAMDFVPVQEQIRRHAQLTPDKAAVTAAGRTLTYRELDELSDQVAHSLIQEGVTRETLVGVLFDREVWAYVAEIGILKAGGAFVPFIPEYPDERIEFCLEDGQIPVLLTSKALLAKRSALREHCRLLSLDELLDRNGSETRGAESALPKVGADNLAYCIYTSGTTGKPKGVLIEHKNIANYVHRNEKSPEITHYTQPDRIALALSYLSFDVSIVEEFVPLCNGCSVVIATEEEIHTPSQLAQLIRNNGVNGITCTPTYLLGLLAIPETVEALQQISFYDVGAEAFPAGLYQKLRELRQDSVILNVYGPTEATMGCAAEEMVESRVVTVGTPIANTQFYIADSFGNPLPVGIRGELMICGEQVGRGYVNLPDKTAASFFIHDGVRAYRSGDLAAWTDEGKIRVFGRIDNQIKLRGFRIELDE
ncbi:amino acid adenylation domain-containing protein, partial [uncultured Anaerovibrio sp.]|uniref:amino acid adenylation domain-containing protein n=1 Tax=uncultured Anaerovibrio sp. TaxID=361586 RepID=UPI00263A1600